MAFDTAADEMRAEKRRRRRRRLGSRVAARGVATYVRDCTCCFVAVRQGHGLMAQKKREEEEEDGGKSLHFHTENVRLLFSA